MKKILSLLIAMVLMMSTLASCITEKDIDKALGVTDTNSPEETASPENNELSKEPVRVFTLKGPTGMGMAPLMKKNDEKTAKLNYNFTVASAADEFTGSIVKGEFEIACVPTNLAAVLNTKTEGAIQIAAVNTLGVLYLLENGSSINSVYDLEGKTIYSKIGGSILWQSLF